MVINPAQLEQDRSQILRELHGLKGAFSFYDFYDLRDILHELESQLLEAQSPRDLREKVQGLSEKLNHFRKENADVFERLILSRENEIMKKHKFLWNHDFPPILKKEYIKELCFTPASESFNFLIETAQQLAIKNQKE
jgi:HPt (histidine-containing phosphotransfer) domain-containing protein